MGAAPSAPIATVPYVDLRRYAGTWFEIARKPVWFERNAVGVTATYTLKPDGGVRVFNASHKARCDAPRKTATGRAHAVDASHAKLMVSFFGPFFAPYQIYELADDYSHAVVGSPDRKTLWILSRTPTLPNDLIAGIVSRFTAKGFDLRDFIYTQPCPANDGSIPPPSLAPPDGVFARVRAPPYGVFA